MSNLYYGWIVTGCAFVVLLLTYGVQYSFGVFVPAIVEDLGWQRASLGGAFSLYTIVYTTCSLLTGRLTDSVGAQRVVGLGAILLGVGIIATSRMSAHWHLFVFYGFVAALGMSTAYIPCNMTVVRWFERRRGLALGIASSGASCGILAVPLVASVLIAHAGWRTGLLVLGALLLVVISVVARFMVGDPARLGLLPDGAERATGTGESPADANGPVTPAPHSWTLAQARGTTSFWMFVTAFTLSMVTTTVPFVHVAGFAADIGMPPFRGAVTVSVIGLFALFGSISFGALSDRIGRKVTIVIGLSMQLAAYALFLNAEEATMLYLGAAAFGLYYGGFASLFPALVGDLFGPAHAGAIGGFVFGIGGLLGGWGPAMAGYLRDVDGDFRLAFMGCMLVAAAALALFALIPRPEPPAGRALR